MGKTHCTKDCNVSYTTLVNTSTNQINDWRFNNPIISMAYKLPNYRIQNNGTSDNCIVFFTSNGYYPHNTENEIESFFRAENDHFEWESISKNNIIQNFAGKIIFVRDVYKQWYVSGINHSIDSINSLITFLKNETYGYHVTTVGSSAGGYAATIVGIQMNAEKIINFSGQFKPSLSSCDLPFFDFYCQDTTRNCYFDISSYCGCSHVPIYYFYPQNSIQDKKQVNHFLSIVQKCPANIHLIKIKSSVHGMPLIPISAIRIITANNSRLDELVKKVKVKSINKYRLCYYTNGILDVIKYIIKRIKTKLHISII